MNGAWFLAGAICGGIIVNVIFILKTTYGVLRIDHSNPEKDIYRLEINDLEHVSSKKRIALTVDNNANLSQE